ncbi:MAG: SH3 domain-containing protein [Anaerolineales bacterium]|nr:MAG: SH3 domain-containing protein [Anaerolineales bacterium]
MSKRVIVVLAVLTLALAACGPSAESVIATGIAQTQQISELQTAAAGNNATSTPAAQETPTPETPQATTSRDVNMRSGDSTAYGVMTVIPGGQTVDVLGINAAGTWLQVRYASATGWISISFIEGDVLAGLPIVTPPAPPTGGGGGGGNNTGGGGGGGGDSGNTQDFSLVLSANNTDNKSISGEVPANTTHRITIRVDDLTGGSEVDIAFQCDTSMPEYVEITAPGADDNTICNNNWSHLVSPGSNSFTISLRITQGNPVKWTVIANVSP